MEGAVEMGPQLKKFMPRYISATYYSCSSSSSATTYQPYTPSATSVFQFPFRFFQEVGSLREIPGNVYDASTAGAKEKDSRSDSTESVYTKCTAPLANW